MDQVATHQCPVPGCQAQVSYHRLMCFSHWRMVNPALQRTVTRLWRSGTPTAGHAEACKSAVQQVQEQLAKP